MEPCRILLADVPRFLRQMLKQALEKDPRLQIVGEVAKPFDLPQAIQQTRPDWVIVSLPADGNLPPAIETFLSAHPAVRFLAVAIDGSHVKAKWVEPHETTLDGLSLDELRAVLHETHPGAVQLNLVRKSSARN